MACFRFRFAMFCFENNLLTREIIITFTPTKMCFLLKFVFWQNVSMNNVQNFMFIIELSNMIKYVLSEFNSAKQQNIKKARLRRKASNECFLSMLIYDVNLPTKIKENPTKQVSKNS